MTDRAGPVRVQRSRRKGYRMPPNTISVARPSMWGNQYRIGDPGVPDAATAVSLFRAGIFRWPDLCLPEIEKMRGKNLACYCPLDQPCHADVLLELANK